MNNFNKVFLAIKTRCQAQKGIAEIDCFELIARECNIPLSKLPMYLNHLQNAGLIKYSMTDKYMYLTLLGRTRDSVSEQVA